MKLFAPAALTVLAVSGSLCSIHPALALPTAGLALDQSAVYGGLSAKGVITLSEPAPAGGLSISLVSSDSALVSVPASVMVAGGKKSATFAVTTRPVPTFTTTTITASYNGRRQAVKLNLVVPAVRWLKFSPYSVAGGARTVGTVYLSSAAPQGGTTVQISSGNPALAVAPTSVIVPAGSVTADFVVATKSTSARVGVAMSAGPGRWGSPVASAITVLPSNSAPAGPTGLTAYGQWDPNCAPCDGMPAPEIQLSWRPVSGASSYTIYRDGTALQAGVNESSFTDMTVVSGQNYSYVVTASIGDMESAKSAAASAMAPFAPTTPTSSSDMPGAPVNLTVQGRWNNGPGDVLRWHSVAGADAYNIYRYDEKIATVTIPTYTVGPDKFFPGALYTVTAVDSSCACESIPSAPATAIGGFDPNNTPSWAGPWVPDVPAKPTAAIVEWNNGQPRVRVDWLNVGNTAVLYRDGQPIADGLWTLYGYDMDVQPGETHTYTVAAVNCLNVSRPMSAPSASIKVSVPSTAPSVAASRRFGAHRAGAYLSKFHRFVPHADSVMPAVEILRVIPRDDSALVVFKAVDGASDYRVYEQSNPNKAKYCGRAFAYPSQWYSVPSEMSIEWNGIDPTKGVTLVVEAVDKPGPFQKMDGMTGPGSTTMDGMMNSAINGQGDPSNVPNVLARSTPISVTCVPSDFGKNGSQVFFDNFRNSQSFTPTASSDPEVVTWSGGASQFAEFENDKWTVRDYQGDTANSKVFVMGNHLMDTLYDGGGPNAPNVPSHNNNASMVFLPKATADLNGGKTLHATFEVDPHFTGRRWCTLWVFPAGDKMLVPGKSTINGLGESSPTVSGNALLWDIHNSEHDLNLLSNGTRIGLMQQKDFQDGQSFERIAWDHLTPEANGTALDLDKRHRFDIYVSVSRFRLEERNAAGELIVLRDKGIPTDVQAALAKTGLLSGKVQVGFGHEVYHTANDRAEILNSPWEAYWFNYRPWSDERHWDNMGFEVLNAFPGF